MPRDGEGALCAKDGGETGASCAMFEVADVVQREGSGPCAGEARCGGGISESRRPCVGSGFVVSSKLRCHVAREVVGIGVVVV